MRADVDEGYAECLRDEPGIGAIHSLLQWFNTRFSML